MSDIHRQVLQQNHVDLLKNLKLDSDILGILYEKGTLTEHMVQVIQTRPTDQDKINELLQLLPKRGPEAFDCFIEAISDHSPWLAEKLKKSYHKLKEETQALPTGKVHNSTVSDKLSSPRRHHHQTSLDDLRKPNRSAENKTPRDSACSSGTKEIIYHDPGVQRNLNHLLAKIKMKLSTKNLREISFSSPEPATFGMIEKLLDDIFDTLELLETTVSRSYTFLGARDRERNLESHIIDIMEKKRKLEADNKEKEQQRNKLYQHINKLDNMCRNHKTTQEHLTTEVGRLKENLMKAQEENTDKQKTIDDLRKLIVELEKPRKGRSRFATWRVQNENNIDEIAKLQKQNKALKAENEQLKHSVTCSLIQLKSDNLKQLAKMREDSQEQEHTDNEDDTKPKSNLQSGIVFSESSHNMIVNGHFRKLHGHYSPKSQEPDYYHTNGKETDLIHDVSSSPKGDKKVRFSDYSPTRYYNQRKPLLNSTYGTDEVTNGYDCSKQSSPIKIPTGRNEAQENKETNDQTDVTANNKTNGKENSTSQATQRSRLVKSIGRSRARRSASMNNMSSQRDPTKMTTQIIKKTKINNQ